MYRIIDTNYAIRYIMQDDIGIARSVKEFIDRGARIIPESLVEVTYALNKGYKVPRKEVCYALMDLLEDIDIIDKLIYVEALRIYRDTKLDYVDCILVSRHKLLNDEIYTMDKELEKTIKRGKIWKH